VIAASRFASDPDRLQRCSEWVRAWSPAVPLRWCWRHRLITAAIAVGLGLLIIGAARAWADPGTGGSADAGNVLISWMGIKDSDGVPVAKYTLTLNEGGWDDPASTMFAKVASIAYEIYLCVTATALHAGLEAARAVLADDGRDPRAAEAAGAAALRAAGVEPEYFAVVDPDTLEPVQPGGAQRVLVVVAARVGPARLIDNLPLDLEPVATP